jgi:hypothetical protein
LTELLIEVEVVQSVDLFVIRSKRNKHSLWSFISEKLSHIVNKCCAIDRGKLG